MIGACFYDLVNYGCNDFDVVGILNNGRSIYIESCAQWCCLRCVLHCCSHSDRLSSLFRLGIYLTDDVLTFLSWRLVS